VQFQLANGLGSAPPPGFGVTPFWLNGARGNFVDSAPDDIRHDETTGCTTCFIYYLHDQLGFSITDIVAAGTVTLRGVYNNLTGRTDGWDSFIGLVNTYYPPGNIYNPSGDSLFKVSSLQTFWPPNQIVCGYGDNAPISIDNPAMAEVFVALTSGNPAVVSVPSNIQIAVGSTSALVPITTTPLSGPFAPLVVNVTASYAGRTLTIPVEVVPPKVIGLSISPSTVTCGQSATGTVTLDHPSLNGDVVVELVCSSPGFANTQPQVIILQNHPGAMFTITTPTHQIPFPTAHAVVSARFAAGSVSATLSVNPSIAAGILRSLAIFPTSVVGGNISHGIVTLEEAVTTDTVVSLAALESGSRPGHPSSSVTVPSTVRISAGQIAKDFTIHTSRLNPPTRRRTATIMASAVVTKYVMLTASA
jgi:hypothetical protein